MTLEMLAALVAGAVALAALVGLGLVAWQWRATRRSRRAWQEVTAAARALTGGGKPDEVAAGVVERARRLVRADWACLWWWEEERLRPGPALGPVVPARLPLPVGDVARRLDRGPISVAELGEACQELEGDAVVLREGERRWALLAVGWRRPPSERRARRSRLRLLAPWAAEALADAVARAIGDETLRREGLLRRAGERLAGTSEAAAVHAAVVEAAREGLAVAACLVERPSGRLVAGDREVAEALVGVTLEALANGGDRPPAAPELGVEAERRFAPPIDGYLPPPAESYPEPGLVALQAEAVGSGLVLVVRRRRRFGEDEVAWLGRLAAAAAGALERCAEHAALQTAERRLASALEELPAPTALWEAEGTLVIANAAYRRLDLSGSAPKASLDGRETEVAVGEPPRIFVVTGRSLAEGRYVLAHYREITRERDALRAKDELISVVGHELKTPLTSIRGYSQMMARQLGTVQAQVDQLNRLIGDLLDSARADGVGSALDRAPVDLSDVARAAAERFQGAHEGRRLRLDLGDVPPVQGDVMRLGQVVDNLLGNAAKYSSGETEIELSVRAEEGHVVLAVRDQGVGIAPEHAPHLFDRFYRAPGQHTAEQSGLGLGLSIVRDLVASHGGRIWVESEGEGKGSAFLVRLPAAETREPVG
ncbi:MAG TPA: HAMP domain-containing sensor histidine kinase [Chloroflexota bacterium]|jgi:signal transduction histidine kinase